MSLPEGAFGIGPTTARLLIRTGRSGVAARVGHDLTLTFETWSGTLRLRGPDVAAASVQAEFDLGSIKILEGTGGALPLTPLDRREITRTALRLLDVRRHPTATFTSGSVRADGDGGVIAGELTIRGQAASIEIVVAPAGDGWRGTATIKQSQFGIAPYKAFLGALRLADEVRIEIEVPALTAAFPSDC